MSTNDEVQVVHHAADSLPGGDPVMFVIRDGRLDIIFSRAATVDEIVDALGPMYATMSHTAMALHAVA